MLRPDRTCSGRSIADLLRGLTAPANAEHLTTSWQFTKEDARTRVRWLYPCDA